MINNTLVREQINAYDSIQKLLTIFRERNRDYLPLRIKVVTFFFIVSYLDKIRLKIVIIRQSVMTHPTAAKIPMSFHYFSLALKFTSNYINLYNSVRLLIIQNEHQLK